jgi:hypothetical protein
MSFISTRVSSLRMLESMVHLGALIVELLLLLLRRIDFCVPSDGCDLLCDVMHEILDLQLHFTSNERAR